jgi:hypothetical protein
MPTQDELLQRIAAAAIPRKLGHLYSRYGQPAPVLGDERPPAPQLGRDRPTAPHAAGLAGRPGSSQQDAEQRRRDMLDKYEDLPAPQDQAAAQAEQSDDEEGMTPESRNSLVSAYGATTPGLEDLLDSDPSMTAADTQLFVQDHAKSGIGWEDWLDQRRAERSGPDQ